MSGHIQSNVGSDDMEEDLFDASETEAVNPLAGFKKIAKPNHETICIEVLKNNLDRGRIWLQPDWQRRSCWDRRMASRLIESCMMGYPIPGIILYELPKKNGRTVVVDGAQRCTALRDFLNGDFELCGLESLRDCNGLKFADLHEELQNNIYDTSIPTMTLSETVDEAVVLELFKRINTNGKPLNLQEVWNCVFCGSLNDFFRDFSNDDLFTRVLRIPPQKLTRMEDRKYMLQFSAFHLMGYHAVRKGLKAFFEEFQSRYRDMSPREIERLRSDFKQAMSVALTIFGDRAFSTLNDRQGWSPSANPVVFRILAPSFARYDKAVLIRNADRIRDAFDSLIANDEEWRRATRQNTGTHRHMTYNFETWNHIIDDIVSQDGGNDSRRLFPKELKAELFAADNTCAICGNEITVLEDSHVDHIIPHTKGGQTVRENARLTHRFCNQSRGAGERDAGQLNLLRAADLIVA
ncbi:HNH endonuclease family protein [Gluconobacter cerinus]